MRAAIDRNEGLRLALAGAVDGARDHFLADAGFAFDQHRDGGGRGLFGIAQHRGHGGAAGDDIGEGERAGLAALHALQFAGERALRQRILQRDLQAFRARRLDHEIGRARTHRGDHVVDAAMRGLNDHRNRVAFAAQAAEQAEAVEIGHHQIEDDAIDRGCGIAIQNARGLIAAFGDHGFVAELAHHVFDAAGAAPDRRRRREYARTFHPL